MPESNGLPSRKSLPMCDGEPSALLPEGTGGSNRRDFLKAAGFTFAGAFLGGCQRAPVQEAIPPLIQPEGMIAGQASFYASTCGACSAGCGLLVKTRDGRPIKLEGNPDQPVSKGGLCAAGQASLLGLYDKLRLQHPLHDGREVGWGAIDHGIRAQLDKIRRRGGAVRLLTGTIISPTMRVLVQRFLADFADARQVIYDPLSCSAILDAHQRTHGVRVLPRYHLDQAHVILGFDADFLGTWISPVEFAGAYRTGRLLSGKPPRSSYHVQVESCLSLTGSKADERICIAPDEMAAVMNGLAVGLDRLAQSAGVMFDPPDPGRAVERLAPALAALCDRLAHRLWQARGRSLVLCGSQDVDTQVVCNYINHRLDNYKAHPALGATTVGLGASPLGTGPFSASAGLITGRANYGPTLDIERPSFQRQGNDRDLKGLLREVYARKVAGLFILDSNPVYDLPEGEKLAEALQEVPLVVVCGERLDETARRARYVCPHPHYLASWGDAEAVSGVVGLRQPTMPMLGKTRPLLESIAAWTTGTKPAYDMLRETWKAHVFPRQAKERSFQAFWDRAVHDGYAEVTALPVKLKPFNFTAVQKVLRALPPPNTSPALVLYPKVGMPDGSHAYNPWLQELPDPISKVTWDNYACLSPVAAAQLGVSEGDVVRLEVSPKQGKALELPVFVQPGQHDRVIAVALGYGSLASQRFAGIGPEWLEARPTVGENGLVGQNAASLLAWEAGTLRYSRVGVKIIKTGRKHLLASTQRYNTLTLPRHLAPPDHERRPIIQETTLAALADPAAEVKTVKQPDLWPTDHSYPDHRWGMVIDLHACTGCSACVIACQAENNIPVVGKDEVQRQREMHWLRIDRYYSGAGALVEVAHQPMLCQHCERAPCETVCPVLATVHSSEGLNEQVYNRCVGTRYCSNNCPYKVRRFNWFEYAREDKLQNLALNPDVTVRSRGVMEKCTFCVQRLEEAKIEARRRGEPLRDGDVQTACQQSCPAHAIAFGDVNNPASQVVQQRKDPRHYQVLAELNIGPSVGYLKVVRPVKR